VTFEEPSRRETTAPGPRPVTAPRPAQARGAQPLPPALGAGVEALAGVDMTATRVHLGSPLPQSVDALAYARGGDIHVAPGQEQHLPHEAWHVAQQLQGRVRPMTRFKGAAGNDDDALEREADVMGARALRLGNRIVRTSLEPATTRAPAQRAWARHPAAIQREPVKSNAAHGDPNYHDTVHTRVLLLRIAEDVYRIKGSEQTVRWKDGVYWVERGEAVPTTTFDMAAHAKHPEFLDFTVSFKEAAKATGDDKSAASDALRLHVLQRFIANALYTAEEIARLNYQASPLNFQDRGLYIRSQATSFVEALKKQLGVGKSTVQLVKDKDFNTVLGQFLQRFDGVARSADVTAKVLQIADFYSQKRSLEGFQDAHGGLFADVGAAITETTLAPAEAQVRLVAADINTWIFRKVAPLVIEQHVASEYASSTAEVRRDITAELQAYVTNKAVDLPAFLSVINPRRSAAFDIERTAKVDAFTAEIAAAAVDAPVAKDFQKYIGPYKVWLTTHPPLDAGEQAFVGATGALIRTTFEPLIKVPSFTAFLTDLRQRAQASTSTVVGQADVATSGVLGDVDRLLTGLSSGLKEVVLVGGTMTLAGQPTMLLDTATSKAMVKEVTIATNKSGYVPTPAAASRAMLARGTSLSTIVADVARLQAPTGKSDPLAPKFKAFIDTVTGFKPETYTSVIDTVGQLARTKAAFDSFASLVADGRSYVTVQAGAIKRLIEGLQLLAPGAALPAIALRQLEVNLADAVANKDDITAFIRNIQNLHEAVILSLEHAPDRAAALVGDELPVPVGARSPHITDYGLQAFSHAYEAVAAQHGADVLAIDAYASIYFELLDKFRHTDKRGNIKLRNPRDLADFKRLKEKAAVSGLAAEVKGPDLVLIDIHPNDASKPAIEQQEVAALIHAIFEGGAATQRVTVIVDITLNHLAELSVKNLREAVQRYIDDGRLNLVFIQSMTKFTEMGSDKLSGGMMFHFNVDEHWKAFNDHVAASTAAKADRTTELYFRSLLKYAASEQGRYIESIRRNTTYVYDALTARMPAVGTANKTIELSISNDPGKCYVAFNYAELAARLWPGDPDRDPKTEQLGKDILNKGIFALADKLKLPLSLRQSFGFPISNMGDAWVGTRFTIGTETDAMLDDYVRLISYVRTELQDIVREKKDDVLNDRAKLGERFKAMSDDVASMEDLRVKLDARLLERKDKL
jgi:hypothetical protein